MNSIGQLAIAVNVESCSYSDATLVAAHDAWREAKLHSNRRLDLSPRSPTAFCRIDLVPPFRVFGGRLLTVPTKTKVGMERAKRRSALFEGSLARNNHGTR